MTDNVRLTDNNVVRLHGNKVCLCAFRDDETALEKYMEWICDESIQTYLGRNYVVDSWANEREFLKKERNYFFNICVKEFPNTNRLELIGSCDIKIHRGSRNAMLGIMIGNPSYRSKGLGTEVIALLVRYCFEELGIHNVALQVNSENVGAIKCYTRCGFKKCGREREVTWSKGRWSDCITMQILEGRYFRTLRTEEPYASLPVV